MIKVTRGTTQDSVPVDGERFDILWVQFEDEAGFGAGQIDGERKRLLEEIESLEARLAEKREELNAVESRADAAKDQLRALISARLSDDAILSAMRIEYKVKRTIPKLRKEIEINPTAEADKQYLLDQLDSEGLTMAELRKQTGRELKFVRTTLELLMAEGRAAKTGDQSNPRFYRV